MHWGFAVWRSDRPFGREVVVTDANDYDYTETVNTAELRAGRGLFGLEKTWIFLSALGIADHDGVSEAGMINLKMLLDKSSTPTASY